MNSINRHRSAVSAAALVAALFASSPVFAQAAAPGNPGPDAPKNPPIDQSVPIPAAPAVTPAPVAPAEEAPGREDGQLDDIVVTAQKRAQNVQDVPIAISAILGSDLAKSGVVTTEDLKTVFAGVNIKTTSSQFQPSVRGIGTSTSNVENAVALYIDGVYYANQSDARRELNDIEQVAVLKGPQGTLFGRNATAGVIQMTTRAPSHTPGGEFSASLDNYLTLRVGSYVTGPISDTVAFSLSANATTQGNGWGENLTTGKDTYKIDHIGSLRGKLLWQPDGSTDITLIADFMDRRDNLGAYFRAFPGTTVSPLVPYREPPSKYDSFNNVDALNRYTGGGASLSAAHDFEFGRLQAISSYRRFRTGYIIDADMTSAAGHRLDTSHNQATSVSNEVQLTSLESGKLNWAAGVFFFNYRNSLDPARRDFGGALYTPLPTSFIQRELFSTERSNSFAPFAQADYELLPNTRLTLGARWTYEKRTLDARWPSIRRNGQFVENSIPPVNGASITAKRPTWRIALDHDFGEDILGYVSWNRGFKSGGFNLANPANPPYQPERLDAYETGLKTTLLNRKLRLNVAGFYYKYDNLQVLQLSAAAPVITNGAKAELYGIDVDFEAQLTSELRLTGSAEALHAEFTSYPGAVISFQQPTGGIGTRFGDVSGNRLPLSQKFVANGALDYTRDVPFGRLNLNAAVAYNGNYVFDPDNVVGQKAYTNINLAANLTLPDRSVTIGLFLRNLLDNKVISYSTASSPLGYITTYDNPPLTYGGSVRFKF